MDVQGCIAPATALIYNTASIRLLDALEYSGQAPSADGLPSLSMELTIHESFSYFGRLLSIPEEEVKRRREDLLHLLHLSVGDRQVREEEEEEVKKYIRSTVS